jgi:hypothetical protein
MDDSVRDYDTARKVVEGMIEAGKPLAAIERRLSGWVLDEESRAALWLLAFMDCEDRGPYFLSDLASR